MRLPAPMLFLLISMVLTLAGSARAMTLEDFGRMNNDDEATYVTLLVQTSAKLLKAHGQPEQAARVEPFFKETGRDGGVALLAYHLKTSFNQNKRNAINPNNRVPPYSVEDAMAMTLKERDIVVSPKELLAAGKDFHPVGPPRQFAPGL